MDEIIRRPISLKTHKKNATNKFVFYIRYQFDEINIARFMNICRDIHSEIDAYLVYYCMDITHEEKLCVVNTFGFTKILHIYRNIFNQDINTLICNENGTMNGMEHIMEELFYYLLLYKFQLCDFTNIQKRLIACYSIHFDKIIASGINNPFQKQVSEIPKDFRINKDMLNIVKKYLFFI